MNKATFKTAQQLFEEAIDLPVEQRTSFVREKVSGDEVLYEVTCELLNNYEALPAYNDSLAEDAVMRVLADTDEPALPHEDVAGIAAKLPAFEILDKIGEGGMGGVYLAKRHGEGFEQTVAIKVLRDGLHSELARERFHQERQILAQLDHPAITRLIDGGSLDDDRPYLVMDYTPGLPITEFCEHNRLTVRQRLELFLKLTAAISHAHQNLVIHRDIKPPNILVGENGQPHLLDFGIAKLQDEEKLETRTGMMVLTPDYASPEQISGKPVTVASDVYALGVLLYELLSGSRPYNWRDHSPAEFEKLVYRSTPLPPSSVESEGFAPLRLTAELDNIVLKALHSDVLQRYHTVDELSADLQRLLNGEAVLAHPPGLIYRTRKFIGRHRLATAALSTIFVLISGFGTYSYLQSQELKIQRDQAVREQQRAEDISSFLVEAFSQADPTRTMGQAVTAGDLLNETANRLSRSNYPDPELHAKLVLAIADAYAGLGENQQSIAAMDGLDAAKLMPETQAMILGKQADNLFELGQVEAALEKIEAALARPSIDNSNLARELLATKAAILDDQDRLDEAVAIYSQLIDEINPQLTPDFYLTICKQFANIRYGEGFAEEAAQQLTDCLGQHRASPAESKSDWVRSQATATLGNFYRRLKEYEKAFETQSEVLDLRLSLFGSDHITPTSVMINLGALQYERGLQDSALEYYHKALNIRTQYYGEDSVRTATLHHNISLAYSDKDDLNRALEHTEIALEKYRANDRARHRNMPHFLLQHAQILTNLKRYQQAESTIKLCIDILTELNYAKGRQLAIARSVLARILFETGDAESASNELRLALPIIREHFDDTDKDRINAEQLLLKLGERKS